jgi:hypothetical protein
VSAPIRSVVLSILLAGAGLAVSTPLVRGAETNGLRAGAARVDITPKVPPETRTPGTT